MQQKVLSGRFQQKILPGNKDKKNLTNHYKNDKVNKSVA